MDDNLMTPVERAGHFQRWIWLGACLGAALGAWKTAHPWSTGEAAIGNLVQALTTGVVGGFVASGACWLWLRRQRV